jgi:hypothetical protein
MVLRSIIAQCGVPDHAIYVTERHNPLKKSGQADEFFNALIQRLKSLTMRFRLIGIRRLTCTRS